MAVIGPKQAGVLCRNEAFSIVLDSEIDIKIRADE
jgi:hypothetical protein